MRLGRYSCRAGHSFLLDLPLYQGAPSTALATQTGQCCTISPNACSKKQDTMDLLLTLCLAEQWLSLHIHVSAHHAVAFLQERAWAAAEPLDESFQLTLYVSRGRTVRIND
eukprot:6179733-Pleurochrysis_carterae.AAC.2